MSIVKDAFSAPHHPNRLLLRGKSGRMVKGARLEYEDNGWTCIHVENPDELEKAAEDLLKMGYTRVQPVYEYALPTDSDEGGGVEDFPFSGKGLRTEGARATDSGPYWAYQRDYLTQQGIPGAFDLLGDYAHHPVVAVLDSGFDISVLGNNLADESTWANTTDDGGGIWNPKGTFNRHGTAVSSIIGSPEGFDIIGAGHSKLRVMPIRVFDSHGKGTSSTLGHGILHASAKGAAVINLSLSLGPPGGHDQYVMDALKEAARNGIYVVAAAGNEASKQLPFPASSRLTISVGSLRGTATAHLSNRGPRVDVWAPGSHIYMAQPGGAYTFMSGTSFAAPFISSMTGLVVYQLIGRDQRLPNTEGLRRILKRSVKHRAVRLDLLLEDLLHG